MPQILSSSRLATFVLIAASGATLGSCSESGTSPLILRAPARLDVISGDVQSGAVGAELPQPLVARVLDAQGQVVPGQIVNFRVTRGAGTVFAGSALTNAAGEARERWTLGTSTADSQVVEVRAVDATSGAALVFGVFRAIAKPDQPALVTVTSGAAQVASPGVQAPDSLAVQVADRFGNVVPGARVDWAASTGGGTLSRAVDTTSSAGIARTRWTAPSVAGTYTVTAAVQGAGPVAISEKVAVGTATQLVADSPPVPTTAVGTEVVPIVRLVDAFGNPIPLASISFTITAGNGTLPGDRLSNRRQGTAVTDNDGRASIPWFIGQTVGANALQATFGTLAVTFNTTGTPNVPTSLVKVLGDGQTAGPATPVAVPPTVYVTDRGANAVPGVTVTFAVTGGGGSLGTSTATTDAAGRAALGSWTLGTATGPNTMTATVPGAGSVTFTALAANVSPRVYLQIGGPDPDAIVGDTAFVLASARSDNGPVTVRATIGARTIVMTPDGLGSIGFIGKIPLAGLPRDTVGLVVTATDGTGAFSEAYRSLIHDQAPVLTVTSPAEGAVVPQNVVMSATCQDDDPAGCDIVFVSRLLSSGTWLLLAYGTSSINETVQVNGVAGQIVKLRFEARDSRGLVTTVDRTVTLQGGP